MVADPLHCSPEKFIFGYVCSAKNWKGTETRANKILFFVERKILYNEKQ